MEQPCQQQLPVTLAGLQGLVDLPGPLTSRDTHPSPRPIPPNTLSLPPHTLSLPPPPDTLSLYLSVSHALSPWPTRRATATQNTPPPICFSLPVTLQTTQSKSKGDR